MPGADDFAPAGYECCRSCGVLFVEGTRRSGRCVACDAEVATAAKAEVVVRIDGTDVVRKPKPKKKRQRKMTQADKQRRNLRSRARNLAMQRLQALHADDWSALLESARTEVGLSDPTAELG